MTSFIDFTREEKAAARKWVHVHLGRQGRTTSQGALMGDAGSFKNEVIVGYVMADTDAMPQKRTVCKHYIA